MKHRCDICVKGYMTLVVEADSEEEAAKKALEMFAEEYLDLPIKNLQYMSTEELT
jgi:hypothetical protein